MPAVAALNSTNVRKTLQLAWHRMHLAVAARLAPARALEAASRLFATPPRFAHTPREQELLAIGERFDVIAPDARLAAWRFGRADRPAIVVSHGWGGRGAQFRAFVPALLDAGYQVVVFDHAGHGLSDGDESSLIHFMRDLGAVVARIEAHAKVAGIIGHSLGAAAVASWLNASRRDMRAVLIAPPTSIRRYSGGFARRLGLPEAFRAQMQQRFEKRLGFRWDDFELPQSVRDVRAKALIVHDVQDRDVAYSSGLALARQLRDARLLTTEGLGHRAILRDPQVVADVVDFISNRVVFGRPVVEPAPIV